MDTVLLAAALPGSAFVALAYGDQFARGFNGIVYALMPKRWRAHSAALDGNATPTDRETDDA